MHHYDHIAAIEQVVGRATRARSQMPKSASRQLQWSRPVLGQATCVAAADQRTLDVTAIEPTGRQPGDANRAVNNVVEGELQWSRPIADRATLAACPSRGRRGCRNGADRMQVGQRATT